MAYKIIHAPVSESTPNHMILPVIVYQNALQEDPAALFEKNGWKQIWENGVFDYHHFHPNTHEVLGVKSGEAELIIGGEKGQTITVKQNDVLLLPAGYGHKRISQSEDFVVVGAYPMEVDVKTEKDYKDINEMNSIINQTPLPETDPVEGATGPVFKEWHNLYHCNTVTGCNN